MKKMLLSNMLSFPFSTAIRKFFFDGPLLGFPKICDKKRGTDRARNYLLYSYILFFFFDGPLLGFPKICDKKRGTDRARNYLLYSLVQMFIWQLKCHTQVAI